MGLHQLRAPRHLQYGSSLIPSATGLQQGDALASFLFSLAHCPVIKRVEQEVPTLSLHAWFLNNGTAVGYLKEAVPLTMDGAPIPISSQADHVGVLRASSGSNLPSISSRIAGHTKSLYSIISCGMARHHRGNPAASIRVESSYSAPKLFSGLASLCLTPSEINTLSFHRRKTLQHLQRLHPRTPAPAVHFCQDPFPHQPSSTSTSMYCSAWWPSLDQATFSTSMASTCYTTRFPIHGL